MTERAQLHREVEKLLKSAYKLIDGEQKSKNPSSAPSVGETAFHEFRMSATSWLMRVFGESHTIYKTFTGEVTHATSARTKRGIGILEAAKKEIDGDWKEDLSCILLKNMLQELLRSVHYQQKIGNSRCAILQCGAVLEFTLQRLCFDAGLSIINEKMQGKPQKKRALQLAGEAYKKKLYDRKHHKRLLGWIELYNALSLNESPPPEKKEERQAAEMLEDMELFLRDVYFHHSNH